MTDNDTTIVMSILLTIILIILIVAVAGGVSKKRCIEFCTTIKPDKEKVVCMDKCI